MTQDNSLATQIAAELPYLRRYGRALTGSQEGGDGFAAATLESILLDPSPLGAASGLRVGLYHVFHKVWSDSDRSIGTDETGKMALAQKRLAMLEPDSREALLLHSIEEFRAEQVAEILGRSLDDVERLIDAARRDIAQSARGRVLIIEDEAIIAMDLEGIVGEIGHTITGIARTADRAIELGKADKPDLVLADIHLADNSSGIDAVNALLAHFGELPVIFITAYPERLLTGERSEPAFLITKPYKDDQVRSAISQALFLSSTRELSL